MNGRRITTNDRRAWALLYRAGWTLQDIAARYDRNHQVVQVVLKADGVKTRSRQYRRQREPKPNRWREIALAKKGVPL